ncbi:hypothetical protein EMPG_10744 [Blastomyces silverae]|uniref:Uncharacterized protein n=1 Tax=Blastomyces silverae TaxID=2060906 RepID=A0A0H1B9D8_9EURO|nr:hypothetical protein EMPG_10744 [Blastomyces silverae]
MVAVALCQLILLGLASGQVVQRPLLRTVKELYPKFDPVLPPPQKYSLSKWTTAEIDRAHPSDGMWSDTLYNLESVHYCKDGFSVYNVTFIDCPEPWLVGHCAKGDTSKEDTFNLLGRLPSSARGVISDLLHVAMRPNHSMRFVTGHSAIFGGSPSSIEGFKMMLTAIWIGSPGIPEDKFAEAVAADSCVADERAVEELGSGKYAAALEGGLAVAAYLKLVKTPPLDASCMSTQLNFLKTYLDARWDAPGQCPNKVAPKLVRHKSVLFPDGMGVLDVDPVPSPSAEVSQWEKSEGYPEPCWQMAQEPKVPGGEELLCAIDDLSVYNVTYSDCPDQDPWPICRCNDSRMSLDSTVAKLGRLTAGLRSYVRLFFALHSDDFDVAGPIIEPDFFLSFGVPPDSNLIYWATHIVNDGFWNNETWKNAVWEDTCWPSPIFDTEHPEFEVFGDAGVAYLYDSSGKSLLERGYDVSCMSHGLRVLTAYAGSHYKQNSKCFERKPNFPIVHPEDNLRPAQPAVLGDLTRMLSRRPPVWMEVTKLNES